MKKGKLCLIMLSAVMLLAIIVLAVRTGLQESDHGPVEVQTGSERLDVWTPDGRNYYAFLPGYIELKEAMILPVSDTVTLEGVSLPLSCDKLAPGRDYVLSWQENGSPVEGSFRLLTSGGVTTMHLDTQSGSMSYIHEQKGNAERGSLRLYDETGQLSFSGSLSSVSGRGNSTWVVHEKKPYTLELTEEADLLGMGAARKWVLLADALDTSALRNKIVYDFAAKAGLSFTPEAVWTELYLNGEYAGLYLLCEKVEIDPQRVDLTPDGSLITMDRDIRIEEDGTPYFVTEAGQYLQIRSSSDIGALKALVQSVEDALLAQNDDSWKDMIDPESWVKKYLIEEIFASYDAGFQSQYFFAPETGAGGRLYAGPVWDYDSSLGNPDVWSLNSPQGLFACRPTAAVGYETPWLWSLYQKPEFRQMMTEEYTDVFLPLLEEVLDHGIADYETQIADAFVRNQIRWDVRTPGLSQEAEHIRTYLEKRLEFLSALWLEEKQFYILRLQESRNSGYYGYYAVESGTIFEDFPQRSEEGFLGWYREDTKEFFDPNSPIAEDICLYPEYEGAEPENVSSGDSLMDRLLKVYYYVPAAVLLLTGIVVLSINVSSCRRNRKKNKSCSKV